MERYADNPYDPTAKRERARLREEKRKAQAAAEEAERAEQQHLRPFPGVSGQDAHFIARECGVRLSHGRYVEPTTAQPLTVAKKLGDYGVMTAEVAQQESLIFLRQVAEADDYDKDAVAVEMPDGTTMSGFRASMLQGMARSFPGAESEE